MSLVKEYFYNIKCDACGCLCDDELWKADSHGAQETADESGWLKLEYKNYCPNCWKYDENDNIITADMNENLDLTKILEGCPKGTKFYSTIYGEVSFIGISNNSGNYPIEIIIYNKQDRFSANIYITKDGRMGCAYDGECTLFPSKDQRDWSKFERFWDKPQIEKEDAEKKQKALEKLKKVIEEYL